MIFFGGTNKYKKIFLLTLVLLGGMFFISPAEAATVSLRASAATVNVGGTFTVKALVNTQNQSINNVESAINFPNDLVEVSSVSTQGSILSLWVEQPNFSNASGQVSFNGGVPNPGYNGSGGQIVTINFKAKSPGQATIYFSGAAVRANDGLGTDVLSGQGSASITINGKAPTEPTPPTEPTTPKLSAPSIYSSTYPDQNAWYTAKSGSVNFRFASGASSVQTLIGNNPAGIPNVSYTPPISSKSISNLTDGVWYFSFRYQLNGQWSSVAHYRIQIDTLAPKNLVADVVSTTQGLALNLRAEDANLDHYDVLIDGNFAFTVTSQQSSQPVPLPSFTSGLHQIKVIAYDKAGNKTELLKEIKTEALLIPVISYITNSIKVGDKFTIAGSSTPNTFLKIVLKLENGNEIFYETNTDEQGNFSFTGQPITIAGNHSLRTYAFNSDGLVSPESAALNIAVIKLPAAIGFVWPEIAISWQTVLPIVGWLILIFFLLYGWYKFFITRRKLLLAKRRAEEAFAMLLVRAEQQINVLDKAASKRKLVRSESNALSELKEIIGKIKEMKDHEY